MDLTKTEMKNHPGTDHARIASELFLSGASCAQAVFCAFCDLHGLERETAARLASSMGAGVGRLREVCGAVSGAAMVMGLLYGFDYPPVGTQKGDLYAAVQEMIAPFRARWGSIVCRDLLTAAGCAASELPNPEERTPEFFARRPCPAVVAAAAQALDDYIAAHPIPQKLNTAARPAPAAAPAERI